MSEYAPTITEKAYHYSKEKLSEKRKVASEKLGRFVSGVVFDRSFQNFTSYTGVDIDPDMYDMMREQHYQDGKEKREYYKDKSTYYARRMGAYAMMLPGVNSSVNNLKAFGNDFMWERRRSKAMKAGYRREHGSFVASTKESWSAGKSKLAALNEQKAELDARKEELSNRGA